MSDAEQRRREREAAQAGVITTRIITDRLRSGQITEKMVEEAARLGDPTACSVYGHCFTRNQFDYFGALWHLQPHLITICQQALCHALESCGALTPEAQESIHNGSSNTFRQHTGYSATHPFVSALIDTVLLNDEHPYTDPVVLADRIMRYCISGITRDVDGDAGIQESNWQRDYLIQVLLSGAP